MQHASHKDLRWERQPDAETKVSTEVDGTRDRIAAFDQYARRLMAVAGIRVRDLVDTIVVRADHLGEFKANGWILDGDGTWRNPAGLFPALTTGVAPGLWLRVEVIEEFVRVNPATEAVEGAPFAPLRRAIAFREDDLFVGVVERSGAAGLVVDRDDPASRRDAQLHLNAFRARRREFDKVENGLAYTEALVDEAITAVGPHRACDLWLKAEREYWMRRCHAGRLQKARQDAVGIGWANIDHHTYDGSRVHFRHTIRILEKLGYELREMLYAGELAGWGSQVLWQPVIGSTIFADLDLAPEELSIDFAHEELPPLPRHRRAGLLSELLGESILEAGLNHVAGLFDNRVLRAQLAEAGVEMMTPFSNMEHLYQELTKGDWAAVDPKRVDALEAAGHIGAVEAEKLRLQGSIVTHLENIERNDGYKGFNREGIDGVLRRLDPRAYHGVPA